MSDTVESSDALQAQALIGQLEACGNEPVNNRLFAGRMPPGMCHGLHPAACGGDPGFYHTYKIGDLMGSLLAHLPDAMPNPSEAFGLAAGADHTAAATDPSMVLDPRTFS